MFKGKVAVIVAHPDDETLWAGGLITRFQSLDVICCTVPARDPERAIKFFNAVRVLGAYPILIPFVESPANELIQHLDVLDLSRYDTVITHNEKGEYGHLHHRQVHEYVKEHTTCNMLTFQGDDLIIHMIGGESDRKRKALECYDHKSSADGGKPKYQALLDRYHISMEREGYHVERGNKGEL